MVVSYSDMCGCTAGCPTTSHQKIDHTGLETRGDPGFATHLVSTFSEWLMALSCVAFFCTFYDDFKNVEFKVHVKSSSQQYSTDNENVVFTEKAVDVRSSEKNASIETYIPHSL